MDFALRVPERKFIAVKIIKLYLSTFKASAKEFVDFENEIGNLHIDSLHDDRADHVQPVLLGRYGAVVDRAFF